MCMCMCVYVCVYVCMYVYMMCVYVYVRGVYVWVRGCVGGCYACIYSAPWKATLATPATVRHPRGISNIHGTTSSRIWLAAVVCV